MNFIITLVVSFIYWVSTARAELVDGTTILNDLSKYSKLYVSYNNCAWSPYVADNNGCGENNENYWYMGLSECFRANVAYSLYGVLQGEEDKGCNKNTFINSFFTTSGISTFTTYMATAGVTFTEAAEGAADISSDCQAVQNDNGDEQAADVENSSSNNVKVNYMSTSYGVGCADKSNHFVMKNYGGAYCDEREVREVTDTLDTFNNDLSQVNCIAIYDDAVVANEEDNQQNNNGGSATSLLTYSEPCNVHLYSGQCPDPYGKLSRDARASAHTMAFNDHPRREVVKTVFSWMLMCFGWILIGTSALVYFRKMKAVDSQKSANANKKRSFFARNRSEDNKAVQKKANVDGEKKLGLISKIKNKLSRSSSNV